MTTEQAHIKAICDSFGKNKNVNTFILDITRKYDDVNSWNFGKIIKDIGETPRRIPNKDKILLLLNQLGDVKTTFKLTTSTFNADLYQYLTNCAQRNSYRRELQVNDPILCTTTFLNWMYSLHDVLNLKMDFFSNETQSFDEILKDFKNKYLVVETNENFLQQFFHHLFTNDFLPKIQKKLTLRTDKVRNVQFTYQLCILLYPIFTNHSNILHLIDDYLFFQPTTTTTTTPVFHSNVEPGVGVGAEISKQLIDMYTYPMDAYLCCLTLLLRMFAYHETKQKIMSAWINEMDEFVQTCLDENNYKLPYSIISMRNQKMFNHLTQRFIFFLVDFCPSPLPLEFDLTTTLTPNDFIRYSQMDVPPSPLPTAAAAKRKRKRVDDNEPLVGGFVQPTDQVYLFEHSTSHNDNYRKAFFRVLRSIRDSTFQDPYQSKYVAYEKIESDFECLKKSNSNRFRSLETMPMEVSEITLKITNADFILFAETSKGLLAAALDCKRLLSSQNASFFTSWLMLKKRSKVLQKIGQVILHYLSLDDLFVYKKMDLAATYLQSFKKKDVERLISSFEDVYERVKK